jgi:hypothetical protein
MRRKTNQDGIVHLRVEHIEALKVSDEAVANVQ